MSLIVRADGSIWCAAANDRKPDDLAYLNDATHYQLSCVERQLVTEPHEGHEASGGRWWWRNDPERPIDRIDPFYSERPEHL